MVYPPNETNLNRFENIFDHFTAVNIHYANIKSNSINPKTKNVPNSPLQSINWPHILRIPRRMHVPHRRAVSRCCLAASASIRDPRQRVLHHERGHDHLPHHRVPLHDAVGAQSGETGHAAEARHGCRPARGSRHAQGDGGAEGDVKRVRARGQVCIGAGQLPNGPSRLLCSNKLLNYYI